MKSVLYLLTSALQRENEQLRLINENLNNKDPLNVRWANGNLNSCQVRITELRETIDLIKLHMKSK